MASHVEISHDLYRWLVQHQSLPNTQKYKPSGNFELELRVQDELQCGYSVGRLVSVVAEERGV
jgi:hypothetical protein